MGIKRAIGWAVSDIGFEGDTAATTVLPDWYYRQQTAAVIG